ncbi:phosphotransferase [Paenibacillus sp. N1-5-1-14]|uniref:phosphotransferase enzyme family protein n=1 Tax=Paenibacillus radicibacter TaxID=2972488 RepID=UPI0021598908|nr:phosphotransferase [Paenibacillus radicibacter]MCR8642589.1 phosphotransferase [Paenibacillus radicibacter]
MSSYKLDSQAGIETTIKRLKNAALIALQHYDLDWKCIRFNQLSDACTFVIQTSGEEDLLLRLHFERSHEEITSEIVWLDFLNEKMNIRLPKGILNKSGESIVRVELEEGSCVYASLMQWVEGKHEESGYSEEQAYQEGILLAHLHLASQQFEMPSNFKLPIWGEQSFVRAMERLTQYHHSFLSDADLRIYQLAAARVLTRLVSIHKDHENYGFIHGDLHQGNIVFYNGEPRPIDFGRCGSGYFLYDLAHTILGLYPVNREFVIKGYQSVKVLRDNWLTELETFMVMVMIESFSHHSTDPRETENMKEQQPYALAILSHYLNGMPFLFNKIDI